MALGRASKWKNGQWPPKIFKPPSNLPEFLKRKHSHPSACLSSSLLSPFLALSWISRLYCLLVTWMSALRVLLPPQPWTEPAHSLMASWSSSHLSVEFFEAVDNSLLEVLCFLHFAHFPFVFLLPFWPFLFSPLPPNSVLVSYQPFPDSLLPLANFSNSFVFNYAHYLL